MRLRASYVFFLVLGIFFISCQNHTEEIWINADGSALIEKTIDLSSMLSFIEMGALMAPQEEGSDNPMRELLSKDQVDTIFVIEDLMKEAAKQQGETYSRFWLREELLKAAEQRNFDADSVWNIIEPVLDVKMRLKMDAQDEILTVTTIMPVSDVNRISIPDLSSLGRIFESESSQENDQFGMMDEDMMADMFQMNEYQYSINQVKVSLASPNSTDTKDKEGLDQLLNTIFGDDLKNKLIVHLPGKVKSVNQPEATFKGNEVTYEIPLEKLQDPEAHLDLEIRFKAKRKYRQVVP